MPLYKSMTETYLYIGRQLNRRNIAFVPLMAQGPAIGSPFIANPDFVERMRNDWPLAMAKRSAYYGGGAGGYIDYPAYGEDDA